ncbi:hypothetical protein [Bradyrhizobium cenepequi]|uniref:hypothetical protein n=1 Tax=Bradyrhizobium cenepequi TaxID=2821403 RepID=UPI001CE3B19F|nr:hypothetical protein [Bradyrhizobium cenepequi]MCA6109299.1 hypothetical protein [Bradyrhizobium cenepequi]
MVTTSQRRIYLTNSSNWLKKRAQSSGRAPECYGAQQFWLQQAKPRIALGIFTTAIPATRSTGTTIYLPVWLSHLAKAYGELGQFYDAWRCIEEAKTLLETTKEQWHEAELHRIAGEIALMPTELDAAKAQAHFERSLAIARGQQARSWELRAATSLARLWRDQGKPDDAKQLLVPVFGWFSEGFGTLDLKQAKALLT